MQIFGATHNVLVSLFKVSLQKPTGDSELATIHAQFQPPPYLVSILPKQNIVMAKDQSE